MNFLPGLAQVGGDNVDETRQSAYYDTMKQKAMIRRLNPGSYVMLEYKSQSLAVARQVVDTCLSYGLILLKLTISQVSLPISNEFHLANEHQAREVKKRLHQSSNQVVHL